MLKCVYILCGDKMKSKIKVFLMCFVLLCMSLFAGCSLVETNNNKLYNAVVADIYNKEGKKVAEISNRELISGYESYGNMYVQYYNYTKAQAVDMTLKQLENRKIVILEAEKLFNVNYETGEGLDEKEKGYIYDQTVESLNANLKNYYDKVLGTTEEEEKDEDEIKFEGYSKNVTLDYDENGNYVIKKLNVKDGLLDGYRPTNNILKSFYNEAEKAEIYDNFIEKGFSSDDYQKALKYYLIDLKSAEYGMNLTTDAKSMFEREIERLYKVNYENYIVQKYSENNKKSGEIASVTTDDILKLYSSKVRASYTKYAIEKDGNYGENVSSSLNDVYYFRGDEEANKYFTVANILFKFDDAQTARYEEINKKLSESEVYDEYESDLNALYSQIKPVIRQLNEDTGIYEEIDNDFNLSVNDIIYDKIQIALKNAQTTGDVGYIGDTINNYIYTYNEDTGMFNAKSNYVIGVDKDGKAVSSFVEEFNEAGLKLYNNGRGKIGDMEVARSSYGIHVLVYTGACENLFDGIDETFELGGNAGSEEGEHAISVLANTRVNMLVDKTYLDLLYDEIYQDNYAFFEQANINFLRENYEIKVYQGRFADSLKG